MKVVWWENSEMELAVWDGHLSGVRNEAEISIFGDEMERRGT